MTRAPQHTYILPRGRTQVVSILCSFKKNLKKLKIERTFDVWLLVCIWTYARAHGRAQAQACTRTHARIPQGGACHKWYGHNLDTQKDTIGTQFEKSNVCSKFDKFQHGKKCKRYFVSNRVEKAEFNDSGLFDILYRPPTKTA